MGLILTIPQANHSPDGLSHLEKSIIELDNLIMDYPWTLNNWKEVFEDIRNLAEKSRYRLFIDSEMRGFALFEQSIGEWSDLVKIATHPKYFKQSVASGIIKQSWEYFSRLGCKTMTLEVETQNMAAINLYKKLGFKTHREISGFYSDGKSAYKMIAEISAAPC